MKYKLVILYLLISISCYSQKSKYAWKSGASGYIGEFDSTIISRSMLDDMHLLCNRIFPYKSPYKHQQLENPDSILHVMDSIYEESIKWINSLNIKKSPEWDLIFNHRIEQFSRNREFVKTLVKAYFEPSLIEEKYHLDTCSEFIQVIKIGGDSMLNFWRDYSYQKCFNSNSDPESCFDKLFTSKVKNDDKYKYVRFKLLMHAWRNCYAQNHPRTHKSVNINDMNEEFKKLFTNVKSYGLFN